MSDLATGVRGHRAIQGNKKVYGSHLRNAVHFAAIKDNQGWMVEPLGWALLVSRGGNPETEPRGDAHDDAVMQSFLRDGWIRICEPDPVWDELWIELHDWLVMNKNALSKRKRVQAVFWVQPR